MRERGRVGERGVGREGGREKGKESDLGSVLEAVVLIFEKLLLHEASLISSAWGEIKAYLSHKFKKVTCTHKMRLDPGSLCDRLCKHNLKYY